VALLQQPTLIIKRKKSIIPAVTQRQVLADALSRYLTQLGLQRRVKVKSIHDLFNDDNAKESESNGEAQP
jgi:hypothetical protein